MSGGLAFLAMFFVQAIQPHKRKELLAEIVYGGLASVSLGFGFLFLLLTAGVFV